MSRPKSDFEALRVDLHQVYDGDPWHGSSITAVLAGIDAEMAAQRPIPGAHTIWEIVLHMTAWTREVASRVRGADAKNPPEDWPAPRFGGGEAAWQSAQDDHSRSAKDLERAVDSAQARGSPALDWRPRDLTRHRLDHRHRDPWTSTAPHPFTRGRSRCSSGPPRARRNRCN